MRDVFLIYDETRLDSVKSTWGTIGQAKYLAASNCVSLDEYVADSKSVNESLDVIISVLNSSDDVALHKVKKDLISSVGFASGGLCIVVGQDGLVVNVAKYARGLPIIGINSNPERNDGILVPFTHESFMKDLDRLLNSDFDIVSAPFVSMKMDDGQAMLALNEFFVGRHDQKSAEYLIRIGSKKYEHQSSSGVLIAGPVGATGWMSSVFNMIAGASNQDVKRWEPEKSQKEMCFAVREPFKSRHSGASMCLGVLRDGMEIKIESHMPSGGVIFSDGMVNDSIPFCSGKAAKFTVSEESAHLVT